MIQHPVHALLTPESGDIAVPANMTHSRIALPRGLPAALEVPGLGLTLLVSAPTARVRAWIEAEASATAAESEPQRAAFPQAARGVDARSELGPVLIVTRGRVPIAVMPLVVNARTLLPRAAGSAGTALELVITSFLITAEAMRGPGAGASFVELAWRRLESGTDAFMAPVARPSLRRRLIATTGTGAQKVRRPIAAELYTETGADGAAKLVRGGLNWRLTHD